MDKGIDGQKDGYSLRVSWMNKADRHKSRAPSLQRQTNRQTNRQTDQCTEWLIELRARN